MSGEITFFPHFRKNKLHIIPVIFVQRKKILCVYILYKVKLNVFFRLLLIKCILFLNNVFLIIIESTSFFLIIRLYKLRILLEIFNIFNSWLLGYPESNMVGYFLWPEKSTEIIWIQCFTLCSLTTYSFFTLSMVPHINKQVQNKFILFPMGYFENRDLWCD